ncbi:MAG TPA: ATP-binding protein [Acidimicrobiales bacterium]|jgi:anti-sigma regulatory factor (Ser/Thr protein kinase)|nr:ATP-binding protein [Acidimicrobiales bacterium]
MTVSARFVGRSASVGEARRFTTDALAALSGEVIDAAALMVSELATNALVHADADFEVTIEITETAVTVEVTDAGQGVPTLRWPEASDPHGRGLRIVEELSDRWGTRAGSDGSGKSVWFTIERAPTPARDAFRSGRARPSTSDPSGSRPWRLVRRGQRPACGRGRSAGWDSLVQTLDHQERQLLRRPVMRSPSRRAAFVRRPAGRCTPSLVDGQSGVRG